MSRFGIPVIAGIVLILGGFAHGLRSDRWGDRPDVLTAAEKLSNVPATIGNWHSEEEGTIDQREITLAGAQGYLSRRYISRDDGRTVYVTILCGRHGPISVHPPTACFVGAGWNLNDTPVKYSIQTGEPPQNKEFWLADFSKTTNVTQIIRTFWSWSVSGDWEAAAHPRLKFANSPFLYKIYITYFLTDAGDPVDEQTERFIKRLLSEIDRSVFESGEDL